MADVFLSYANADRDRARTIVEAMGQRRWRVFWDRTIPAGHKWPDVLNKELRRAKCVVVLLTRESIASSWVQFEASVALHRGALVPLLADATLDPQRDLPEMFHDIHILRLDTPGPAGEHWLEAVDQRITASGRRRAALNTLAALGAAAGAAALWISVQAWPNFETMRRAGLDHVEWGDYSVPENTRLGERIRQAHLIEMIASNANGFTTVFRPELQAFLERPGTSMRMLFARPDTEFYDEMMSMTTRHFEPGTKEGDIDKGLSTRSRGILLNFADRPDRVEVRTFNTEFRMPLILIDRKYCFLTVRLTPDESKKSVRLEFAQEAGAASEPERYVRSCMRHFDAIWARGRPWGAPGVAGAASAAPGSVVVR
jgi:hypothetical protein